MGELLDNFKEETLGLQHDLWGQWLVNRLDDVCYKYSLGRYEMHKSKHFERNGATCAVCPVCFHMNISAEESDLCEHFDHLDEMYFVFDGNLAAIQAVKDVAICERLGQPDMRDGIAIPEEVRSEQFKPFWVRILSVGEDFPDAEVGGVYLCKNPSPAQVPWDGQLYEICRPDDLIAKMEE
jgi:hypothetical protein